MRAMNLLPPEERGGARAAGGVGRTSNLQAVHGIAGVGAVVTVGLVGFWAMTQHDTASARQAEAAAVARSAVAQQQVTLLAPVVAFDARRQARETAVLTLASGRTDWAQVLRATAGSLPSNVSVTTLKLAAGDATGAAAAAPAAGTTGLAATNGTVTLQVCADTQPRVATTLRRFRALPQVDDVALSQTARTSGATGGGATGGASCGRVNADAALSLSQQTIIDGVPTPPPAAPAAPGTATPPDAATTTSSTATTNGTGR